MQTEPRQQDYEHEDEKTERDITPDEEEDRDPLGTKTSPLPAVDSAEDESKDDDIDEDETVANTDDVHEEAESDVKTNESKEKNVSKEVVDTNENNGGNQMTKDQETAKENVTPKEDISQANDNDDGKATKTEEDDAVILPDESKQIEGDVQSDDIEDNKTEIETVTISNTNTDLEIDTSNKEKGKGNDKNEEIEVSDDKDVSNISEVDSTTNQDTSEPEVTQTKTDKTGPSPSPANEETVNDVNLKQSNDQENTSPDKSMTHKIESDTESASTQNVVDEAPSTVDGIANEEDDKPIDNNKIEIEQHEETEVNGEEEEEVVVTTEDIVFPQSPNEPPVEDEEEETVISEDVIMTKEEQKDIKKEGKESHETHEDDEEEEVTSDVVVVNSSKPTSDALKSEDAPGSEVVKQPSTENIQENDIKFTSGDTNVSTKGEASSNASKIKEETAEPISSTIQDDQEQSDTPPINGKENTTLTNGDVPSPGGDEGEFGLVVV